MRLLEKHAEAECCDIVTTGRVSGRPHEIEIWFGVVDETMYLISGNGPGADWYRNVLATPEVVVKLAGERHLGSARDVTEPDERRRCGELMGEKYVWDGDASIGLTYDAWCFDVPAIEIEFDSARERCCTEMLDDRSPRTYRVERSRRGSTHGAKTRGYRCPNH